MQRAHKAQPLHPPAVQHLTKILEVLNKMVLVRFSIIVTMLARTGTGFIGPQHVYRRLAASSTVRFAGEKENTYIPPPRGQRELNWMDRVIPFDMETDKEDAIRRVGEVEEYNIGISGVSFQTGPLSARMYEAMMSRQNQEFMSDEIKRAFKFYAMDFTAKEATRTALKQNGFEMPMQEGDITEWGFVDSIQLLDPVGQPVGPLHDNWNRVVDQWTPGQGFDFVAREVPVKLRDIALQDILDALDPDGSLRRTVENAGLSIPTEDLQSLTDLANEVKRRCEEAPRGSSTSDQVYKGDHSRGYSTISRSELHINKVNIDGSENQKSKFLKKIEGRCCKMKLTQFASADARYGCIGWSWLSHC